MLQQAKISTTAPVSQPRLLSRLEVQRGLRISTIEGLWATVWATLTTGSFQTGFALLLGASPFVLGLMAGLPAVVNLLQLPASLYVEKRGERRKFVAIAAISGRLLWLALLLIPFLLPAPVQLPVFLALLTLSSALLTLAIPAWTSWISDLVPASSRGEYFGRRNMLAGIIAMLAPLPAGAFLDQAVKYNRFDPRLGFAVLFGLASFAAIVSFVLTLQQPEPPMLRKTGPQENPLRSLFAPLRDKNFQPFVIFSISTVIGQTVAGQFFTAWQVDKNALNLPYLTVQILAVAASGAGLLSTPLWGYLADKYGTRPVLMIGTAGTIVAPLLWILTNPQTFWLNIPMIVVLNIFAGASWAGVGLAQFNLLLSTAAPETRATYMAMFSATTGIVGFFAPILGGVLMGWLEPARVTLGPVILNNYKWLFLLTAAIRIGNCFLLRRVPAPDSQPTRYVLAQLWAARPLSSYVRARRLTQPIDAEERLHTVDELAELRSPLAIEELATALNDVSLEVRENAARALGAIRDPRAIPALAEKLNDPAAGIGALAAAALGEIGDRAATPYLAAVTSGPDAEVRIAALKALAAIADPASVPALLAALDPAHPARCEAACAALIVIGPNVPADLAVAGLPRLLYLLSQEVDRGMRFAAARTLAALATQVAVRPEAYETICQRLFSEEDAAVLAQEMTALVRIGMAAHQSLNEFSKRNRARMLLEILLPVLDRDGMHGLAYKQALQAVADVALPPGTLYRYLGLSEVARDEAVNRLLGELRRKHNTISADMTARAMEAFSSGQWETFVDILTTLGQSMKAFPSPSDPLPNRSGESEETSVPIPDNDAASVAFFQLHDRIRRGYGTAEESLLCLLLLRHLSH